MKEELLHLYKELYKTGAYFYRNPQEPGLHLIIIDKPRINLLYEYRVPEVRRQLCCIYLGRRICSRHCQRKRCFCVRCQLYNTEEENPAVNCQKCNFLSECYSYKLVGKIGGRDSYILQSHCIDHCQLEGCPHRDEVSVALN